MLTDYAYLHLIGVAVALVGLVIAIWGWPRADRVTRTLVVAIFAVFAAGAVSPLMQPISGAHEIAIMLPLSAALAGRVIGPWLAGRRRTEAGAAVDRGRPRRRDGPGVGGPAAEAGSASRPARAGGRRPPGWRWRACSSRPGSATWPISATTPPSSPCPRSNQTLADWLVAHHLTSGLGGYWDADVTALDSGGKVTIAPLVDAGKYGYPWESKAAWFDPKVSSANFVIAHVQALGAGYLTVALATTHYGKPAKEYFLGKTVVLVYDRNLLTSVIQPTPAYLYGPPSAS